MNIRKSNRTIGKKSYSKSNASVKLNDVAKSATSPIKKQHTPNDESYLKEIRFGCPFCNIAARPKVYDNLWKLRIHFRRDHDFSLSCQNLIATLENLIERKVLL